MMPKGVDRPKGVILSIDEMSSFINNNYHALSPTSSVKNSETVFGLNLSDAVVVQIWTSINNTKSAGVGNDSIKVTLNSSVNGRPLLQKQSIVKRVESWRTNLNKRISETISLYFEDPESFDKKANEAKPSSRFASEKQINFALRLMNRMSDNEFVSLFKRGKPSQNELEKMTSKDVSILIDGLQ
jgi:hypothetical protein